MKRTDKYFIIDFDSTFVTVETLEELAKIVLKGNPQQDMILQEMKKITDQGMDGTIPFDESLSKRLVLFQPSKKYIAELVLFLKETITPSIQRNKEFFHLYKDYIYIISGGFEEYIIPIVNEFGIPKNHVLANKFIFDKKGQVIGFDKSSPLSKRGGKIKAIRSLNLAGEMYIIGDGFTDYEVKKQGVVDKFYAFIENIQREKVVSKADVAIKNLDELLYSFRLPRAYSYPKSKIKALLLEKIHPVAEEILKDEGYTVDIKDKALNENELATIIDNYSILGIRSKTQITAAILSQAKKLHTIGVFAIGTNQIDLHTALEKGITVFNAPYSNTRSVVELIIGEIIMLYRKAFDKSMKLHQGIWDKVAKNCHEIRGKKLGIVGYGNIGSQLSVLAENLGMQVYFYDIIDKLTLGNAQRTSSLQELLKLCDVITIHVDGRKSNRNLIGEKEFALMKDKVIFLNASRGFIVDIEALVKYIKNGKISGAAVDVFPQEPYNSQDVFSSVLQGLSNVILTPHIGAGTEEAQKNIGLFVANKIINFINTGSTLLSVNFPQLQLDPVQNVHRLIHIHKNVPGVLAKINNTFAKYKINVEAQYLQTNDTIGYVITDVNKMHGENFVDELKKIPETIKLRILY